jgi:hypothetical protein
MLISTENLRADNYKQFINDSKTAIGSYTCSYQKRFDDSDGIRYFITVNVYNPFYTSNPENIHFEATCNFNGMSNKIATFDVLYFVKTGATLEEMESFFNNMWVNMKCDYYEIFEK